MREIDNVLERGERVLWEGTPSSGPFILKRIVIVLIMGGPFLGFLLFSTFSFITFSAAITARPWVILCGVIPFLIIVPIALLCVLLIALSYKNTYYAVTTKRMIIQKGIIGRDYTIVEFRNFTHAEVNVSFLDKIFQGDTGSLKVHTAGTGGQQGSNLVLENIEGPYELFRMVNKRSKKGGTSRPRERAGWRDK